MSEPQPDAFTQYHLSVEAFTDKHGPAVMLTQQDDIQEAVTIVVHPWQLRAACEHLGILCADPEAERIAARLTRRLESLAGRIRHLNDWLRENMATGHAGPSYGQAYSQASADLAGEFLADDGERRCQKPQQGRLL